MKNTSNILLAVLVMGFLWTTASGERFTATSTANPGTISVSGEAEVRVIPDEVRITLGVETWHKELSVAKGRNDRAASDVIAIAQRFGIASKHIQTDYISIEPRYEDSYFRYDLEGYFVRKSIVITLQDISLFEDLLTAVTEEGATNVYGIDFRTSELRKHRDQARALATQAAKEKAEDMAGVLDLSIGSPRTIHEDHAGWSSWYSYYGWWGAQYSLMSQNVVQNASGYVPETEGSFAPGQISVTARVSVTFEMAP